MKKKIFLFIFIMLLVTFKVNATTAKAPTIVPTADSTTKFYSVVDEDFDFSKVKFTLEGTASTLAGKTDMKKISLSNGYTIPTGAGEIPTLDSNWFTAYCLDGENKYPLYGYVKYGYTTSLTDTEKLNALVAIALYNQANTTSAMYTLFSDLKTYNMEPTITYTHSETDDATALAKYLANETVTVKVTGITFMKYISDNQTDTKSVTKAQLIAASSNTSATDFELELNYNKTVNTKSESNTLFDLYNVIGMPNSNTYNHALWIIEHTYPTLTLNKALSLAGVNTTTLKTELMALDNDITETNYEEKSENYIYSTIQYAIWNVYEGIDDGNGHKLGSSLVGSDELNKLYTYLIKDRSEYTDYNQKTFGKNLTIVQPTSGEEIYKETDDYYVYGPYSVSSDMIDAGTINLSIKDSIKGASIVNKNLNTITSVNEGDSFYIKTIKSNKIANLTLIAKTESGLTFDENNRGRVYYSNAPHIQNLVTGGKYVSATVTKTTDLVFNPKTGVMDIGIILLVGIVSFSIGYIVLSYNNKQLELN